MNVAFLVLSQLRQQTGLQTGKTGSWSGGPPGRRSKIKVGCYLFENDKSFFSIVVLCTILSDLVFEMGKGISSPRRHYPKQIHRPPLLSPLIPGGFL